MVPLMGQMMMQNIVQQGVPNVPTRDLLNCKKLFAMSCISNKINKHSQSIAEQELIVITAQTATLNLLPLHAHSPSAQFMVVYGVVSALIKSPTDYTVRI